ncbi:hypothetical protein EYM_05590 [Ignicoccus islandicus DSM 13165]|uniref:Uncharacterized protein n=1 Tax=Ignicoccus islandicus DSM 13165 TaxID=940295 RepID=A0A0U3FRW0_9CREN|nr:hypothetical protein [Ignicoccus islandicus]ALU12599.1 hypothetical protein EYM_05590 [Ignicoccus islandicus DSM 13165]
MECGPPAKRLPSITGKDTEAVLKELWKNGLNVRKEVEEQVKAFVEMARKSNETVSAFVIGEWGEGKTSVFDGYVRGLAKDFCLLSVSARRIVDSVRRLRAGMGHSSALIFASALLHSISMEGEERGESLVDPYKGEPLHEYSKKALDQLFGKCGNKKVIVFIDEFEEIVSPKNKDVVSEVLNGLVELINGEYGYLSEKYPGRLHLMVALTPYAYVKALTLANIDESLKGRTERRLHFKIELRPLSRVEAFNLAKAILNFAFGEDFSPFPYQFLNTLYTIAQGNPGALTSLLRVVLSHLSEGNCTRYTKDPYELIEVLSNTTVFTYVGSSKAIDKLYFERILTSIARNEAERRAVATVAAYYYPLTLKEMSDLGGVPVEVIETLDQRASLSSTPLLEKFWRTDDYSKAFMVILESLRNVFTEGDEEEFRKIIEELTYPKGESNQFFLVIPDESSAEILEDIIGERRLIGDITKLASYLKKKLEEAGIKLEESYMLSRKHAINLYPPPAVSAAFFIKDPQMRAKAWKDALNAVSKGDVNLDKALVDMLLTAFQGKHVGKMVTVKVPTPSKQVPVTVYPKAVLFRDIELRKIAEEAKREGANVLLVLTKSDIANEIEDLLSTSDIDYFVIGAKDVKVIQLAVYSIYSSPEKRDVIDPEKVQMFLKRISEELGIREALEKWAEKAYKEGIIVDDLPRISGASEESIAEAYTFYLAYPSNEMTTEEVFEHVVKTVRKFMIYGRGSRKKVPFSTGIDVESPSMLKRFEDDLVAAGLLERRNGKLRITMSKVEKRILNEVKKRGKAPWKAIEKEFILVANNKRILSDFYLKILEKRGLVRVERRGNEPYLVELVEPSIIASELDAQANKLEDLWNKNGYKWSTYAHIVVSKKKEDNLILLEEVKDYVEKGALELRRESDAYAIARRATFLLNLGKYLEHQLVPVTRKAYEEASRLIDSYDKKIDEFKTKLRAVTNKTLSVAKIPTVSPSEFEEVVRLHELMEKAVDIDSKPLPKDVMNRLVAEMRANGILPDLFYFEKFYDQRSWALADFFNLKYHLIKEKTNELDRLLRTYEDYLREAEKYLNRIENKEREVVTRLESLASGGFNTRLSSIAYSWLKELIVGEGRNFSKIALSLKDLVEMLSEVEKSVGVFDDNVLAILKMLDELKDEEVRFHRNLAYLKLWYQFLSSFYDRNEVGKELDLLKRKISELESSYRKISDDEREPNSLADLSTVLRALRRRIAELNSEVEKLKGSARELHEAKMNELIEDLRSVKKTINLLKKLDPKAEVPKAILNVEMKIRKLAESAPTSMDENATYSKLKDQIEKLKTYVKVNVKSVLSEKEVLALELVSRKKEWKLNELIGELEGAGVKGEEALKIILSLQNKGLLEALVTVK